MKGFVVCFFFSFCIGLELCHCTSPHPFCFYLRVYLFSSRQGKRTDFLHPFFASLLALKKKEAVMILCYAVLEGICVSSVVTQAWKEMEGKILGFGDSVRMLKPIFAPRCVQSAL